MGSPHVKESAARSPQLRDKTQGVTPSQACYNTAVRCGDARQEGEALAALAKGHDLSLQQSASQKPPISPTIFTAHFKQLFSKTSDQQTLGLTEEKAGPRTPPRVELSGAPTPPTPHNAFAPFVWLVPVPESY
jgi:hypothetical protein